MSTITTPTSSCLHDMFWCCFYAVEYSGHFRLVYGYAVSAQEPEMKWGWSTIHESSAWNLHKFTAFMNHDALVAFQSEIKSGHLSLVAKRKGQDQSVTVDCGPLEPRPTVYAEPRTLISRGSPQSFSDELSTVDSLWCLSKRGLIDLVFPDTTFAGEEKRLATKKVFTALHDETGINFLGDEAGRFGNFEVARYLSEDCRTCDGLCTLISKPEDSNDHSAPSLIVWIEPPLAEAGALSVSCRMFNGGGTKGDTCIWDEIRPWQPGTIMRFAPLEPFTLTEITVWKDGRRVAYQKYSIVRSIGSNMTIVGPPRKHITPWSNKLQGKARDQAQAVPFNTTEQMTVGSVSHDPWRESEREAEGIVQEWFPPATKGRFFANENGSNLEALDFLITQMRRPGVSGVVIADPYFDRVGVESLLARVGNVGSIRVLTSHGAGDAANPSGTVDLLAACNGCAKMLPPKLSISNVDTKAGGGQQFHDRYVLIEFGEQRSEAKREVWMLSNSLSSFAKRYPLVITPLATDVAKSVADYLADIEGSRLKGRPDLQATPIWSNHSSRRLTHSSSNSSRSTFPGAGLILEILAPETPVETDRAATAVMKGLIKGSEPEIDWQVPTESLSSVVGLMKTTLAAAIKSDDTLLHAFAYWSYWGGPNADAYAFNRDELNMIAEVLTKHLKERSQVEDVKHELEELESETPLPESLEAIWRLQDGAPLDVRSRATPQLHFFAKALWLTSPSDLVYILDETKNLGTLCWLAMEAYPRDESCALALMDSKLGAVQALGLLFLRDIAEKEATSAGPNRLAVLASNLAKTKLPELDSLLAMIFISARYTRPGVANKTPFADCSPLWPKRQFSPDEISRIARLANKAAPLRAVPRVAQLAQDCPIAENTAALHQWCVNQMLAQLPLAALVSKNDEIGFDPNDAETLKHAAKSAWQVHGANTPNWYKNEVLKKLHLWGALEPLLRTRDYSKWNDALENILLALRFGVSIAENAPTATDSTAFEQAAAPAMAGKLLKLGPELWHHFGDFHGRLSVLSAFIGKAAEAAQSGSSEIERFIAQDYVPSLWKLWVILQSPKLTRQFASALKQFSLSPTTPSCARGERAMDQWLSGICAAANALAEANEDLKEAATEVIGSLTTWRDGSTIQSHELQRDRLSEPREKCLGLSAEVDG